MILDNKNIPTCGSEEGREIHAFIKKYVDNSRRRRILVSHISPHQVGLLIKAMFKTEGFAIKVRGVKMQAKDFDIGWYDDKTPEVLN